MAGAVSKGRTTSVMGRFFFTPGPARIQGTSTSSSDFPPCPLPSAHGRPLKQAGRFLPYRPGEWRIEGRLHRWLFDAPPRVHRGAVAYAVPTSSGWSKCTNASSGFSRVTKAIVLAKLRLSLPVYTSKSTALLSNKYPIPSHG